ncbi:RNA methyltransferase [Terasakiella sp. A23]|uniref:RNA methyltransferase n=1 Tax=Terasakiella sp. FCG-A23 TaxID=3080561 RepID=UPI00295448BC|nr:RNA methyltransferase [Terasakiella sp. A23]MDV7339687.1 RNA methyltransferase [Terasakiella sp. A23]
MRGYFGIGIQGVSKAYNVGNLFRTAHAFGASFVYTVDAKYSRNKWNKTDTSKSVDHTPFYSFPSLDEMMLPQGCQLVGVELTEDAIELPSFRHPTKAAYLLGPERSSLTPATIERCDHIIKIPMKFCINVGTAGALVMYDRLQSLGRFADRPVRAGGPTEPLAPQGHGGPIFRNGSPFEDTPPDVPENWGE